MQVTDKQELAQLTLLQLFQAAYWALVQHPAATGSGSPKQPRVVVPLPAHTCVGSLRHVLNSVQHPGTPFTQVGQSAIITVPMVEPQYG